MSRDGPKVAVGTRGSVSRSRSPAYGYVLVVEKLPLTCSGTSQNCEREFTLTRLQPFNDFAHFTRIYSLSTPTLLARLAILRLV